MPPDEGTDVDRYLTEAEIREDERQKVNQEWATQLQLTQLAARVGKLEEDLEEATTLQVDRAPQDQEPEAPESRQSDEDQEGHEGAVEEVEAEPLPPVAKPEPIDPRMSIF